MDAKSNLVISINTDEYKERLDAIREKIEEIEKEVAEFNKITLDIELKYKEK